MRTLKKITAHVIILGLCLTVAAPGAVLNAKTKKPKLSKKSVTVTKGKAKTIKLTRVGKKGKVTW